MSHHSTLVVHSLPMVDSVPHLATSHRPSVTDYSHSILAPESSLLRTLYVLASVTNASGVPYALTFLRRTNGALSRKANKLAGPGPKNGKIMALTYAFNEDRSVARDKEMNTSQAIERWSWHNYIRTVVLVLGTILGAVGVALDGK